MPSVTPQTDADVDIGIHGPAELGRVLRGERLTQGRVAPR